MSEERKQWICTAVDIDGGQRVAGNPMQLTPMGVAAKNKLWPQGKVLKVRFLQGSAALQDALASQLAARAWLTRFDDSGVATPGAVIVVLTGDANAKTALANRAAPRPYARDSNTYSPDDAQVDGALADRLHLGAEQRHTRFPGVEDVVVVKRLAVLGDVLLRFFARGLGHADYIAWLPPSGGRLWLSSVEKKRFTHPSG